MYKKTAVLIFVAVAVVVFGSIFLKQLSENKNELSDTMANDLQNYNSPLNESETEASSNSDALADLEKDLDAFNMDALDAESTQLEAEIEQIED